MQNLRGFIIIIIILMTSYEADCRFESWIKKWAMWTNEIKKLSKYEILSQKRVICLYLFIPVIHWC